MSGAALSSDGGLLVLATDEGSELLVVSAHGLGLEFLPAVPLGDPNDEIDLEGITRLADPAVFVAVGSHSWRRKNIYGENHAGKTYSKLKERFEEESPDREKDRDRLMRVELDPQTGVLVNLRDLPLRPAPRRQPRSQRLCRDSQQGERHRHRRHRRGRRQALHRLPRPGPSLRPDPGAGGRASATDLSGAELRYVPLDGRGIRDIARVSDGFLILAGPVGDSPLSYELVFWDGNDGFPGVREAGDPPLGKTSPWARFRPRPEARPKPSSCWRSTTAPGSRTIGAPGDCS